MPCFTQQILERVGTGDDSAPVRITVEVDALPDLAAVVQRDVVSALARIRHWGNRVVQGEPVVGRPERVSFQSTPDPSASAQPPPYGHVHRVGDNPVTAVPPPGALQL